MERHKLESEAYQWFGLLLLGVAALIAWQVIPAQATGWDYFDKVIDVVTAVATTAAVVVSLWLARASDRRQDKEKLIRARLLAARLVADLEGPLKALSQFVNLVDFQDSDEADMLAKMPAARLVSAQRRLDRLMEESGRPQWIIDAALLEGIVPLGNSTAHRLEYGCRSLVAINRELVEYSKHWQTIDADYKEYLLSEWAKTFSKAERFISVAFAACQDAAALGAPEPSPDEIYGDVPF